MSDPRCKCPMAISMTGDGCRYCQPQEHIDRLGEWLDEERSELAAARDEAEKLRGRCAVYESRLRDYEEYMERMPRMILRKQAEAVERAKHEHALTARIPDGTAGEHFQDGFDTAAEQYDASIYRYAQRLRNQADELEKSGGSNDPNNV